MDENLDQIGENWRNEDGTFKEGHPDFGAGRPVEDEKAKLTKRAIKELVKEYKEDLAQILPEIKPILIELAKKGDMAAIKEIHDRVMDKSKQKTSLPTDDNDVIQPILVKFIDGQQPNNNKNPE